MVIQVTLVYPYGIMYFLDGYYLSVSLFVLVQLLFKGAATINDSVYIVHCLQISTMAIYGMYV